MPFEPLDHPARRPRRAARPVRRRRRRQGRAVGRVGQRQRDRAAPAPNLPRDRRGPGPHPMPDRARPVARGLLRVAGRRRRGGCRNRPVRPVAWPDRRALAAPGRNRAETSRDHPSARRTARAPCRKRPRAARVDSRAWTGRRQSRIRIRRRRISIRDSNSPSAGAGTAVRSTDRSTTARNPSPQSRREVVQAASAASSQAYSRSSSMIQLARYTAGWKKKTACAIRCPMTTQRSPRRTWASSWSRTQVNCLGVRPIAQVGGDHHGGPEQPADRRANGAEGGRPIGSAPPSPAARRRASRSIGSQPGRSGTACAAAGGSRPSAARNRSSSQTAPEAQRDHQHRRESKAPATSLRRPTARRAGRDRSRGRLGETTGRGAADASAGLAARSPVVGGAIGNERRGSAQPAADARADVIADGSDRPAHQGSRERHRDRPA